MPFASVAKKNQQNVKLPIGIEDFAELRKKNYYFVDKSLFIKDLLDKSPKVLLLTRPRRFGKTLLLSMVKYFFSMEEKDNIYW